jgi:outer membrane protein W
LRKSNVLSAGLSPVFFDGHFHGYASYKTEADCRDEIIMQYKALRLPLYIKACYNRNRIRPFIKAGVFGSWMLSSNYVHFAERQRTDRIYQDWYNDYKLKADIGFLSSAGVRFMIGHARQLEIEIDYKSGNQNLFYTQKDYGFPMDTKINTRVMGLCLSINI